MTRQTTYKLTWYTGCVVRSLPTGRIVQDADGWWHEEYTPIRTLAEDGTVLRESPAPVMRWRYD